MLVKLDFINQRWFLKSKVEKRKNEIVNRLNKTKREEFPDLKAQRELRDRGERNKKKGELKDRQDREKKEIQDKKKYDEMMDYSNIMIKDQMVSNKSITKSVQEYEDDFM